MSILQHELSRIWTCTESTFWLCLMKSSSFENHYTRTVYKSKFVYWVPKVNESKISNYVNLEVIHLIQGLLNSSKFAVKLVNFCNFILLRCYYNKNEVKSSMCVRDVLEIINFTNCRTWLFFNKYAQEHTFSVSWVREATLRNLAHMNFKTTCTSDS